MVDFVNQRVPSPQDVPFMEQQPDVVICVVVLLDQHVLPPGQLVNNDTEKWEEIV